MTMLLGGVLIVVAVIWFLYKAYLSYKSAGGTDFMVPVYDAAIYPPLLIAAGLYLLQPALHIAWSIWIFLAIAAGLTAVFGIAIRIIEEVGDKEL